MVSKNACLVLEDGTCFTGDSFGASGSSVGEVVFNTSMSGYQEIITDPSYCGQMVVMTAPEIGNTGVNINDMESDMAWLSGFIVHSYNEIPSNYRSEDTLSNFLKSKNTIAISGIDTRALTKKLRQTGTMRAVISDVESDIELLKKKAKQVVPIERLDLISKVTTKQTYHWTEGLWNNGCKSLSDNQLSGRAKVLVYDFGTKRNILRQLVNAGFDVWVASAYDFDAVKRIRPDALLLSNGPGDPAAVDKKAIRFIRDIAESIPAFGICLGNQLLGLSFGYSTYRLKFGHHGANQPVLNLLDKYVTITSQNHNFAVDISNGNGAFDVIESNLNDGTVETIKHHSLPIMGVQYHPEASPGPHDAKKIFKEFERMVNNTC